MTVGVAVAVADGLGGTEELGETNELGGAEEPGGAEERRYTNPDRPLPGPDPGGPRLTDSVGPANVIQNRLASMGR